MTERNLIPLNLPHQQDYGLLLIKSQQDCIESFKLSLRLMDEKFIIVNQQLQHYMQLSETWKTRYTTLEKQFNDLQLTTNNTNNTNNTN